MSSECCAAFSDVHPKVHFEKRKKRRSPQAKYYLPRTCIPIWNQFVCSMWVWPLETRLFLFMSSREVIGWVSEFCLLSKASSKGKVHENWVDKATIIFIVISQATTISREMQRSEEHLSDWNRINSPKKQGKTTTSQEAENRTPIRSNQAKIWSETSRFFLFASPSQITGSLFYIRSIAIVKTLNRTTDNRIAI